MYIKIITRENIFLVTSVVILLSYLVFQSNDIMVLLISVPIVILFLSYKLFKNLTTERATTEQDFFTRFFAISSVFYRYMGTHILVTLIVILLFSLPFSHVYLPFWYDNKFIFMGILFLVIFFSYKLFKNLSMKDVDLTQGIVLDQEKIKKIQKWSALVFLPPFLFMGYFVWFEGRAGQGISFVMPITCILLCIFIYIKDTGVAQEIMSGEEKLKKIEKWSALVFLPAFLFTGYCLWFRGGTGFEIIYAALFGLQTLGIFLVLEIIFHVIYFCLKKKRGQPVALS